MRWTSEHVQERLFLERQWQRQIADNCIGNDVRGTEVGAEDEEKYTMKPGRIEVKRTNRQNSIPLKWKYENKRVCDANAWQAANLLECCCIRYRTNHFICRMCALHSKWTELYLICGVMIEYSPCTPSAHFCCSQHMLTPRILGSEVDNFYFYPDIIDQVWSCSW